MSSKPACKYGNKCYRKNPDHLRNFSHPKTEDEKNDETSTVDESSDSDEKASVKQTLKKTDSSSDAEPKLKKRKTEEENVVESTTPGKDDGVKEVEDEEKEESGDDETPPSSPDDVKGSIKAKFLMEMPDDYYDFWNFCSSLNPSEPLDALKCLKLRLVGPFDVSAGRHKNVKKNKHGRRPNYLLHYRFYYDPPEFQTVLVSKDADAFHMGYFRDDPAETPVFVASNSPGSDNNKGKITPCGENLFAAVHIYASKLLKSCNPFEKTSVQKLTKKLEAAASNHSYDLSASTKQMKERQKKVVCPSFHGAGIVVPVDDNEVGYRPVPETPGDLKAMMKGIAEAKSEKEKERYSEQLQELITLIQFANDECDYGEGLELGMDLFSYGGNVFHQQISLLLPLAYQLLNRSEFASIITAHLKKRRSVGECIDELA